MCNYRASHDSVIKSNFLIKNYSTQSVGLRARLPQEEEAEEWRPGEEQVSLAEALVGLWLPLERAQRACAICELGQVT